MEESSININSKDSIIVSRNHPLAFVVGVSGFIGSHLAERLLSKGIQVVGVDNLSFGKRDNLENLVKNKNFHLLFQSIDNADFFQEVLSGLNLPRLDYAFFVAEGEDKKSLYSRGLLNFLNFINNTKLRLLEAGDDKKDYKKYAKDLSDGKLIADKPKIVFVSSINLYSSSPKEIDEDLKDGEIRFAKFIKHYKLNGRILRFAPVYGPRMHFRDPDPSIRIIQASLRDNLDNQTTSLDFTTRAIFIDDAIDLLVKTVLSGATAHKIYDGALYQPVKVAEIKQILMDPLWHENKGFKPSEMPPWPTPNLLRTMQELSWEASATLVQSLKKTINYFTGREIKVPEIEEAHVGRFKDEAVKIEEGIEEKINVKNWSFAKMYKQEEEKGKTEEEGGNKDREEGGDSKKDKSRGGVWKKIVLLAFLLFVGYALIWPAATFGYGVFNIRNQIRASMDAIGRGDFEGAGVQVSKAQTTLDQSLKIANSLQVLKRLGLFSGQLEEFEGLLVAIDEGLEGMEYAISGSQALFQTTKIISGETNEDPNPLYQKAQSQLTVASQKISRVRSKLEDESLKKMLPLQFRVRVDDLSYRLNLYGELVDKARSASFLLPQVTALGGKKSYLVLLQNELELRPTGGFIGSYAKLSFENGKLSEIKVDDIYNLDGQLKDVITPPAEMKGDLNQDRLYLRDSNFEADFPTSAKRAEFFYKRATGETVQGVFALDLAGTAKLLGAVGGLDLPDYGEHIDEGGFFEKVVAHTEEGTQTNSKVRKNYLTSVYTLLFDKIFYLSKQNWPGIIQAMSLSLEQKHMLVYLADPTLFSYLASENWGGIIPRGAVDKDGSYPDFLATVDSNVGANKANYFLERSYSLDSVIGKNGEIVHKMRITYKNNSPSETFPAGKYKNRFKIYLPIGAKLQKASFGEVDIMGKVFPFSDYGRSGYSVLLEIEPKEQKILSLEYTLARPLGFKDGKVEYRLDVIKQAGTREDKFDWKITYPIDLKTNSVLDKSKNSEQELSASTNLSKDRSFVINFEQK